MAKPFRRNDAAGNKERPNDAHYKDEMLANEGNNQPFAANDNNAGHENDDNDTN